MPEEKLEDVLYDFANETLRNLDGNADPTEDLMENLYAKFIKIWTYLKHSIFKNFWIPTDYDFYETANTTFKPEIGYVS